MFISFHQNVGFAKYCHNAAAQYKALFSSFCEGEGGFGELVKQKEVGVGGRKVISFLCII